MTRPLCLMALFLVLAVGCGKKDSAGTGGGSAGDDNARLQGSWSIANVDVPAGGPVPTKDDTGDMAIVISGTSLKLSLKGNIAPDGNAVLKLDASKSPKEFDLTEADEKGGTDPRKTIITVRDGKPEYRETPRESMKGIYKFDGDSLVIAVGSPGSPRPTDFKPTGDRKGGVLVATLKKK